MRTRIINYILDKDRNAIAATMEEAVRFFETIDNRRVAEDTVGKLRISTVFLMLDHGWGETPVLFETMIFDERKTKKHELDGYQTRYATWRQAEAGHEQAVREAEEALGKKRKSVCGIGEDFKSLFDPQFLPDLKKL